jgi:hypothetical protein
MKIMLILWYFIIIPTISYAAPEELKILYDRKIDFIIQDYSSNIIQIPTWLNTFYNDNGTWADIDYTSGCTARRANWPAQQHFVRIGKHLQSITIFIITTFFVSIVTMASQYRTDPTNTTNLLFYISKAMDYWFDNNYKPDACLDQGGLANSECPCGTPGFWNKFFFSFKKKKKKKKNTNIHTYIHVYIHECLHLQTY